ncbi:hypothetical protein BCR41DRAFT_229633 [Lobosporangium transversale]|uniref:Uncharacterized protein n=1 Tax=Lobosporangium transversale TaxID=64571 RepID=A0A1Y2G625_9FUNG|nr:hypothetical protein BCR41DRAFT_229633 [Lobosporangium transversale]ORY97022.1 hypothetical protein BCR41DRAFT_229633 [Lobosporangium transversale]|eukprot:XP_021875568.1 hypothetical protein BCR41DRAFT_229633 [Lobosporangium transversale]
MDERARHANVYAMRAHAARNLPLISAAHHRALQLILATEANDIRLSPQQRRNARTLQQHYQQQYVDTCLHRNSINDTNSKSKSKNVDNADKERDKQNDMDWEMDQNNSNSSSSNNNGGGGSDSMDKNRDAKECIVSRVSALVDKALEMKRTKRGYVSAVQSSIKREANLSDYTICLTDIATLLYS